MPSSEPEKPTYSSIFDLSAYDFQNLLANGLRGVPLSLRTRMKMDLRSCMREHEIRNLPHGSVSDPEILDTVLELREILEGPW